MVLCENMKPDMTPLADNTRHKCLEIMERVTDHKPWFGIEQESASIGFSDLRYRLIES